MQLFAASRCWNLVSTYLVLNANHKHVAMVAVLHALLLTIPLQHDVAGGVPARHK